ncbi:hypothetical protein KI688_000075 [Linnemannia hyalina]|uniref:DNA 3'-5' helicase n=1 Tax=Linnemannia hyalina TaxID=64524 RepID=A0A9P7Y3W0_9FUNG|nr:hypothetical protein KI688_000075 [Linnemannia hyalina]
MSNKRQHSGNPATPSKRAPRLQGISVLHILGSNKPDTQSSGGANQDTPGKVAEALLSLGGIHSPLERSAFSWDSMVLNAVQVATNPFWQFLSSPSQAVLEQLIPMPDEENEDSDDEAKQQLEVLEHIAQKIDCVLIASCDWDKTPAFFLPMAYCPGSITAIISPQMALMNDQQQKLVNAKIHHIVLSGDNSGAVDGDVIRRICEGEFRAVFMSPEIIFGDSPTSRLVQGLWRNTRWRNLLLAIVVDEVHCVEKWDKFRPEYARLGELRIWSPGVPFVGVTTTLAADALTQTMDKLFLSKVNVLRVQEIPTNVRLEVHTQPKDAMEGLNPLLGKDKTIIYFEKISILIDVSKYLSRMRPDLGRIGVYFSTLRSQYKESVMTKFAKGDIHILLATEAAGMG